jgi:FHA domain-containing protein
VAELRTWLLKEFFHSFGAEKGLEETFPGAFLMIRFRNTPPLVAYLEPNEGFTCVVGGDEDADIDFMMDPTLEPLHCKIAWHTGFSGWTVEDLGTSFGTAVQDERIDASRPVLLTDKDVIKPGGGLLQLQFYAGKTLFARMTQAGVTRTVARLKDRKPKKAAE